MESIKNFLKAHWVALVLGVVLVIVTITAIVMLRSRAGAYADSLTEIDAAHHEEIEKINQARELEKQEHAQQLQVLQDTIARIESDYADAQARLKDKETKQKKEIVQKFGNDADGLAGLLNDRFGFNVVKP